MEVMQLETLTGLECVSFYLLELMHFSLGGRCLEIARTFLHLGGVLWRSESEAMLNQIALETRGNKEFNRDSFAESSNNGFL